MWCESHGGFIRTLDGNDSNEVICDCGQWFGWLLWYALIQCCRMCEDGRTGMCACGWREGNDLERIVLGSVKGSVVGYIDQEKVSICVVSSLYRLSVIISQICGENATAVYLGKIIVSFTKVCFTFHDRGKIRYEMRKTVRFRQETRKQQLHVNTRHGISGHGWQHLHHIIFISI